MFEPLTGKLINYGVIFEARSLYSKNIQNIHALVHLTQ